MFSHCIAFHTGRYVMYVYVPSLPDAAASAVSGSPDGAMSAAFADRFAVLMMQIQCPCSSRLTCPPAALICWNPPHL